MFALDMPPTVPVVIVAAAPSQKPAMQYDGAIGVCRAVWPGPVTDPRAAPYDLAPGSFASDLVEMKFNKKFKGAYIRKSKVTLLKAPEHGKIVEIERNNQLRPTYNPDPDFVGKDRATFLAEIAGYRVRVEYYIRVGLGSECPGNIEWKISSLGSNRHS